MDVGLLFSGTKWNIIEQIAQAPKSPFELAQSLGTSIANISIQLRLLEMGNVVTKQRISNAKAGKPRILYSLKQDFLFVTSASKTSQLKSEISLDNDKQFILNVWRLPAEVQPIYVSLYYAHKSFFESAAAIYAPLNARPESASLVIVPASQTASVKSLSVDVNGKKIMCKVDYQTHISSKNLILLQLSQTAHATGGAVQ